MKSVNTGRVSYGRQVWTNDGRRILWDGTVLRRFGRKVRFVSVARSDEDRITLGGWVWVRMKGYCGAPYMRPVFCY